MGVDSSPTKPDTLDLMVPSLSNRLDELRKSHTVGLEDTEDLVTCLGITCQSPTATSSRKS